LLPAWQIEGGQQFQPMKMEHDMGLFSAIGTAVGGIFGGPAGAAVGGAIGGAIDGQKAEKKASGGMQFVQAGGASGFNPPRSNFDLCMCQASYGKAQHQFDDLRSGNHHGGHGLSRQLQQIEQSLNEIEKQLKSMLDPTPHCGDRGRSDGGPRDLLHQIDQLRGDISELRRDRNIDSDDFCRPPMHHHRFDDDHYMLQA
jgi:hypothetical protein